MEGAVTEDKRVVARYVVPRFEVAEEEAELEPAERCFGLWWRGRVVGIP